MDNKIRYSKKEKGFIKDYIETGNGVQSALKNYDTNDYNTAGVIASENLKKPKIQKAIAEALPDEILAEKHLRLLEQKQLNYFVFSKNMEDEDIKGHLEANGLELIVIRLSDKGKMAFYSIDDAQAIKGALDMAYKLKGSYAPEKKDITIEPPAIDPIIETLANKINEIYKGTDSTSNGTDTNSMDSEISDKE